MIHEKPFRLAPLYWVGALFWWLVAAPALASGAETSSAVGQAQERLAQAEKEYGPLHLSVVPVLRELADLYLRQGDLAQAQALLQRMVQIQKVAQGTNHPSVAELQTALANIAFRLGDLKAAMVFSQEAVQRLEASLGGGHLKTANARLNLARLYSLDRSRSAEVVSLVQGALPILESQLWPDHPRIAEALMVMSAAQANLNHENTVEAPLRRALAIREKNYGADHPLVAETARALGWFLVNQGKFTEGDPLLIRANAISKRVSGENDPSFVVGLERLGDSLVQQKKYADALHPLEQALLLQEKILGQDHPLLVKNLNAVALVYLELGEKLRSRDFFQRALGIAEKEHASNPLPVAFILVNLGDIYWRLGEEVRGRELFRRAYDSAERFFHDDSLGLANWLASLGSALRKSGNVQLSGEMFLRSLHLLEVQLGSSNPQVQAVRQTLQKSGMLPDAEGKTSDAPAAAVVGKVPVGVPVEAVGGSDAKLKDTGQAATDAFGHLLAETKESSRPPAPELKLVSGTDLSGLTAEGKIGGANDPGKLDTVLLVPKIETSLVPETETSLAPEVEALPAPKVETSLALDVMTSLAPKVETSLPPKTEVLTTGSPVLPAQEVKPSSVEDKPLEGFVVHVVCLPLGGFRGGLLQTNIETLGFPVYQKNILAKDHRLLQCVFSGPFKEYNEAMRAAALIREKESLADVEVRRYWR